VTITKNLKQGLVIVPVLQAWLSCNGYRTPIGLAFSLIKKGRTGEFTGVGNTVIEVESLDSLTGGSTCTAVDYTPGGKMSGFEKWSRRVPGRQAEGIS
jgi:hypothetical protein